MIRSLRDYQGDLVNGVKKEYVKKIRSILVQLATGGGKTRIFANITNSAERKGETVWIIAPRKKLVSQASKELTDEGVRHGIINATNKESPAFNVHVCSRDTLNRRIKQKRIRNWPSIIIIDEAHTALDQQIFIKENARHGTLFLGFTATPELLSGRGLNEMYKSIVYGPNLQWLVEHGYLKRPKCFSIPPVEGLDKLKFNKNGDVSAKELSKLFAERCVYGDAIENYRSNGLGRSFLVFCRSIEISKQTAEQFRNSGFRVEHVDGEMKEKDIESVLNKVANGELDGVTSVELVTYGLDVPKLSCIIMLRPTESKALFFQMVGRGLRPQKDFQDCLIFDHVGNCSQTRHGHPLAPVEWNFDGSQKKKKAPKDAVELVASVDKCPVCWDLMIDGVCRSCGAEKETKSRKPLKVVDGYLVEITEPTPLKDRPPENRREYQDMIAANVDTFRKLWTVDGKIHTESVKKLLEAAHDLKRSPMWVYHELTKDEKTVNISLLQEISKIKNYKPGWLFMKRKSLEGRR